MNPAKNGDGGKPPHRLGFLIQISVRCSTSSKVEWKEAESKKDEPEETPGGWGTVEGRASECCEALVVKPTITGLTSLPQLKHLYSLSVLGNFLGSPICLLLDLLWGTLW